MTIVLNEHPNCGTPDCCQKCETANKEVKTKEATK
jgi:hypothetical protein